MPYAYKAGDYYQAGDNYGAYAAGSLLGNIWKGVRSVAGAVARTAVSSIPVVGPVITALAPPPTVQQGRQQVPVPGVTGVIQRLAPGGETGFMDKPRRRINPLNIKALRRAMRRAKGFERQARRVGSFFNPGKTFRLKGRKRRSSR